VIACDELTAFDALDFIDVEYEPLRTYAEPEESLAFPEPRIHDYGDSATSQGGVAPLRRRRAGVRRRRPRVRDTFFYQATPNLPIEQHAASREGSRRKLVLWSSTQTPHYVHRALARRGDPAAHIRVIALQRRRLRRQERSVHTSWWSPMATLMLDRPVKICLTRERSSTAIADAIRY